LHANVMTIRTATPDDFDVLDDLIRRSYAMLDDGSYNREKIAAAMPAISHANPRLLASGTYFLAESDGEVAGCGGWTMVKPGTEEVEEGVAHVRHFATHPAHQRKGVAKMLLERCIADAASAGVLRMKSQSTLPGEAFYASVGFRRLQVRDAEMAPGINLPVVDMERVIP
jgi:predicted N-acetyltransferase YhbS